MEKASRAVLFTLLASILCLHVVFYLHAGGLWRDEATSVNLASLPLHALWQNLQYDSFPVLWSLLLRFSIACGLGATDSGLRTLGLVIGMGVLLALWRNARAFGREPFLVSLVLLGLNVPVLVYGDSVRGYGLGMILGLLTLALAFEFVDDPRLGTLLPFALVAVTSVHCVFYNAILLLAAAAGGAALCARRGRWRAFLQLGGVGIAAALTLLVYRGMKAGQESWIAIVQFSIGPSQIWRKFSIAANETGSAGALLWVVVALGSLLVAALELRRGSELPERRRDVLLYASVTLLAGIVAYYVFLLRLRYLMQSWYFLSLLILVGSCANAILGESLSSARGRKLRIGGLAAVIALAALLFPGTLAAARVRKTNLDLVAATLARSVAKEDLVIVFPWQAGISFARYYRGAADWVTIPPISAHELHRYDLLKQAMMSPDVMQPLLDRMRDTLRAGGRIFWVGDVLAPPAGEKPPHLPPAPQAPWRWAEAPHYRAWVLQAGWVLRGEAATTEQLTIATSQTISKQEALEVRVFQGKKAD